MMNGEIKSGDQSTGHKSSSGRPTKDHYTHSPKQLKSRSGPQLLGLARCAACYNQRARSMPRWVGDCESSSSAEDSGPEDDCESEAETRSRSTCSEHVKAVTPEKPETETQSPVCAGEETGDTTRTRTATLVESFSLPTPLAPHLAPLSILPRPPRIVSTLHLQVLSEKHDNDTFFTIRQHPSEGAHENTGQRNGGGTNNPLSSQSHQGQQTWLPWQQWSPPASQQHQYQYQYQQHQHQNQHQHHQQQQQRQQMPLKYQQQPPGYFPPSSAQGQMLPATPHTLPVFHPPTGHTPLQAPSAPKTHVHTFTPQPCCFHYHMNCPYHRLHMKRDDMSSHTPSMKNCY